MQSMMIKFQSPQKKKILNYAVCDDQIPNYWGTVFIQPPYNPINCPIGKTLIGTLMLFMLIAISTH